MNIDSVEEKRMFCDVVMCTWNSNKPWFETCLKSIKREIPIHCFILIDRFSQDGTTTVVRNFFPDSKIILTNVNLARARRLGIQHVDTEYFIFVDDDVKLPQGWFRKLGREIDPDTGAIHQYTYSTIPYRMKWIEWLNKWTNKTKGVSNKILEVTKKNMEETRGYTNNTILRTEICRDWNPPKHISAFEDHLLLRHVVKKGFKWKIIEDYEVKHYTPKSLKEHLVKVRWETAGSRAVGFKKRNLKDILVQTTERSAAAFLAGLEMKDPRILPYVLLTSLSSLNGYFKWNKYSRFRR